MMGLTLWEIVTGVTGVGGICAAPPILLFYMVNHIYSTGYMYWIHNKTRTKKKVRNSEEMSVVVYSSLSTTSKCGLSLWETSPRHG